MTGSTFKRCTKCGAKVEPKVKRCAKCSAATWTWSYVCDVGRGPDGKRRQRTKGGFATRQEADRALRETLASTDEHRYIAPSRLTLGQFLESEWLPAVRATVRPTTLAQYRQAVRVHLVPALGGVALQALSPAHLNALYADLLESGRSDGTGGLSPKSVRHVHVAVRKALGDAVRWGRAARNVAAAASPPRLVAPELRVWTVEQLRAFLVGVAGGRLFAAWLTLATTGLRRGELLGLEWRDIDLDARRLSVRRAVTVVNGRPVATEPKTVKGRRTLALDTATVAALREHRRAQLAERIRHADVWHDSGLVFCHEDGSAIHPEQLSRAFTRHAKAAGVPAIGIHGVRHSYATAALAAGESLKVVSERLGHASVSMTLDVYSHVLPSHDEAVAEAVATLILGAGEQSVSIPGGEAGG